MSFARLAAAFVLAVSAGCAPTATELADEAEAAQREGDYGKARVLAERGLDAGADAEDLRWKLNRVRFEALAGAGEAATLMEELDALAPVFPEHIDAGLWARLGREAAADGKLEAALLVLDGGRTRFPDSAAQFEQVMRDMRAEAERSHDDATLQRLSQIPYLGGG